MSGQTLPAELPPNYRQKHGGRWLRDQRSSNLNAVTREMIFEGVEAAVEEVLNRHKVWFSPE